MTEIELSAGPVQYEDTGGDGPVVVLLHGLLMDSSLWDGVVDDLAADHRCVAPTLPLGAHRRPMRDGADLSLPAVARLVGELLDRLDLRDVTLVGNDTGGALVQLLLAEAAATAATEPAPIAPEPEPEPASAATAAPTASEPLAASEARPVRETSAAPGDPAAPADLRAPADPRAPAAPADPVASRVGRVVLASCEAFDNLPPGLTGRTLDLAGKLPPALFGLFMRQMGLRALRRLPIAFGRLTLRGDAATARWVRPVIRQPEIRRDAVRMLRAAFADRRLLVRAADGLAEFDRPALVVWAREDRVMPPDHGRRLAELLPRGRLVEVADSYTLLPLDQPERLAALIRDFVRITAAGA